MYRSGANRSYKENFISSASSLSFDLNELYLSTPPGGLRGLQSTQQSAQQSVNMSDSTPPVRLNGRELLKGSAGIFDGENPKRWLRLLREDLVDMGFIEGEIPPGIMIRAIDNGISMAVAKVLEMYPKVSTLLESPSQATPKDVIFIQSLLARKYIDTDRESEAKVQLASLAQKADETLASYYQRTAGLLQLFGCRDLDATTETCPLSGPEKNTLKDVVLHFVVGLTHNDLRQKAIDMGGHKVKGLLNAYHWVAFHESQIDFKDKANETIICREEERLSFRSIV